MEEYDITDYLKDDKELQKAVIDKFLKEIAELKAENERLKEENKTLEQLLSKEPLALQALQKGYASYKESTDVFYEMVKTYKQALQEIKAIAETYITDCQGFKCEAMEEIMQKITKAEEE